MDTPLRRVESRPAIVLIVFTIAGCLVTGCRRQTPSTPVSGAPSAAEMSWEAQIASVRNGEGSEIRVINQPIDADQWSELNQDCDNLTILDVETLNVPEDSLSVLSGLPQLRRLRIGSSVGDRGVQEIARIESLEVLNLPQGTFTDAGLGQLTALPRLELLRFRSPNVTDDAMPRIAEMPALRYLHLIDVPITDAGLTAMYEMEQLESFYLDGGNCTEEGLSKLLHELPDLHFHLNDMHLPDDPHAHPHDNEAKPQ